MALTRALAILASAALVIGQRPPFAGTRPIGFPELTDRTTTPAGDLGNRFGEGTTQRLPLEALGDRDLVDRLSKLPIDQQPFWFINWQALEQHRKNPQTYPQRPSPFNPGSSSATTNPNSGLASSDSGLANSNSGFANSNLGVASSNSGVASSNSGVASSNSGVVSSNSGVASSNSGVASSNSGLVNGNSGFDSSNSGLINSNVRPGNANSEVVSNSSTPSIDLGNRNGAINPGSAVKPGSSKTGNNHNVKHLSNRYDKDHDKFKSEEYDQDYEDFTHPKH